MEASSTMTYIMIGVFFGVLIRVKFYMHTLAPPNEPPLKISNSRRLAEGLSLLPYLSAIYRYVIFLDCAPSVKASLSFVWRLCLSLTFPTLHHVITVCQILHYHSIDEKVLVISWSNGDVERSMIWVIDNGERQSFPNVANTGGYNLLRTPSTCLV